MRRFLAHIILLVLTMLFFMSCSIRKHIPEGEMIMKKNKIEIMSKDATFKSSEISKQIIQGENKKIILGFYPLTWVYYKTDDNPNNKFISLINRSIGRKPTYYDNELQNKSMMQIESYLNNIGYFNSKIYVESQNKRGIIKLIYRIYPSQPYIIDQITFNIKDSTIAEYVEEIQAQLPVQSGNIYNAFDLDDERDMITEHLKNNGYYFFTKDYIYAEVDTNFLVHKANINIRIDNATNPVTQATERHKQYYVNNIFIYPKGIPVNNQIPDTVSYTFNIGKRLGNETYKFIYTGDPKIRFNTFENMVQIRSGMLYNTNSVSQTYKSLSNLKIFNMNNIDFQVDDNSNDSVNLLNCNILLNRAKANYYNLQIEGTLAGGEPGIATSLTYRNKNFIKGSEIFNINIRGGLQRQRYNDENDEISIFNTHEFGTEISIFFPRPLLLHKFNRLKIGQVPRTTLTLGYNYQSRPIYQRQTMFLTFGYNWIVNKYVQHIFTPFTINSVKVDPTPSFNAILEQETNQRIKDQYTNHLIFGLDYSYIFTNQGINSLYDFYYIKANIQTSGNLISALNNTSLVKTVDNYHEIFGIRYSQFIRFSFDFRYYRYVYKDNQIATRFMFGVGIPYGNSNEMPFEKSFYAGGPNGMRGWHFRELGPGTYNNSESINIECIGDIQLEMNLEYRHTIQSFLKGAIFIDVGNIWTMRENETFKGGQFKFNSFYKQLAVDAGIGLRLDIGSFLLVRVDAAAPIVNPIYPEGERWRINKLQFKDFILCFGIGYPF